MIHEMYCDMNIEVGVAFDGDLAAGRYRLWAILGK